jgi:hypothetical protein
MPVPTIAIVFGVGVVVILTLRAVRTWWKYRGDRLITCPENHRPAGISLAAGRAAAQSLAGKPQLQLSACSRWPERAGCGQECLSQVHESPEGCLVRSILVQWYEGKCCASCQQPFGDISLVGVKPAVLLADKVSLEWSEIPVERLREILASASPICFACHMGNTLVRKHPELVVDRNRPAVRSRT